MRSRFKLRGCPGFPKTPRRTQHEAYCEHLHATEQRRVCLETHRPRLVTVSREALERPAEGIEPRCGPSIPQLFSPAAPLNTKLQLWIRREFAGHDVAS